MRFPWKRRSVLPGFGLSLGLTIFYLCLVVLIPTSALFLRTAELGWSDFVKAVASPRALASYRLTFGTSLIGALLNALFGFVLAWILVRYRFPGRRVLDALIDLPFALPTAVSGIALTTVYAKNGWLGQCLAPLGIKAAYSPLGITIAITFIGLPFVVRTLQPALAELDGESEEAAAALGATRWQTFWRVIVPTLTPSLLTGFALAFARALGEYGSVVFISGNMPMKTEVTSLLIITKLEQYDYAGATALAVVMLLASFFILLAINVIQWRTSRWARVGA
jgi:sulfate transport system permease protein